MSISLAAIVRTQQQQDELRRLVTQEPGFKEDVWALAVAIKELILIHHATPVPVATIQRDIMEIITLKRLGARIVVTRTGATRQGPKGWTSDEEELFFHWIHDTFTEDLWTQAVMTPVFQADVRPWEDSIEGWRSALQIYLDQWIVRSMDLIAQIYPPEEEEEDTNAEFNTHAFTGKSRNFN